MAAQTGKDLLIKVGNNDGPPETFTTVSGMQSKSIAFNSTTVDITDSDSTNRWRELLEGAGVKTASVSGDGVFKDSASEETVRGYFFGGSIHDYQVIIPDFGTVEGLFQITALEYSGEQDGESRFSMTLESAGALTWTAA